MAGLPASYIKRHNGDMKAAWADYHRTHGKGKKRRSGGGGGESVVPTADGVGVQARGRGLHANITAHTPIEFNREALGAMWDGFFAEARIPAGVVDTSSVFPPHEENTEAARAYRRNAQEREIGRELYRTLGIAAVHFKVTPGEFQQFLARATAGMRAIGGMTPMGGAFQRPFDGPTVITNAFGAARPDGSLHRGVDLQAAEGTPVHSPYAAKVDAVFSEQQGGNVVRLALQTPGGGYANDVGAGDDSGLLLSFLHLQSSDVKAGDVLQAGQVFARSGNTGSDTTGPHLHVMAEYFNDAPLWSLDSNTRVVIDPVALFGGREALEQGAQPVPFMPNQVLAGIAQPREEGQVFSLFGGAQGPASQNPITLKIDNRGALVVNGGTAVNVPIKAVLPLGELGNSGDGGWSNPPVPDALRGAAASVMGVGGQILHGIGSLAGHVFGTLTSPEGFQTVVRLGSQLAGAAGALAGVAGPLLTLAAPFITAIPVVGEFLGPAAGIAGPVLTIGGPVAGALGGVGGTLGNEVLRMGVRQNSGPAYSQLPFGGIGGPAPQSVGDVLRRFQP